MVILDFVYKFLVFVFKINKLEIKIILSKNRKYEIKLYINV